MKVIHLPSSVGNHGYSLASSERDIGIDSTSLVCGKNNFNMRADRFIENRSTPKYILNILKEFIGNRNKYSVFHFNYGRTLLGCLGEDLNGLDLPFYNGKRIMTFNGSDLRRSESISINPYGIYPEENLSFSQKVFFEKKRSKLLKNLTYIDHCFVTTPDLLSFLPKDKATFIPHLKYSLKNLESKNNPKRSRYFTVAHAPTNRLFKGSDFIIDAMQRISKENKLVRFVILENLPHDQLKNELANVDLVIDQVRLGWYGAVSLEAMSKGTPAAVYINEHYLSRVEQAMGEAIEDSFLIVNPENIYQVLTNYIEDSVWQKTLESKCLEFISEFHNPNALIKKVVSYY
jgi:glycosyltransferase involved in cell wall biosynthesis